MGETTAHTLSPTSGPHSLLPEYVIYTFRKDKDEGTRSSDLWQNMGVSHNIDQAREKARTLYRSSRYSRIELRKKFIDEKNGAVIDIPVEVLGEMPNTEMRNIVILLGCALGCALLALTLSVVM